VDDRADLFVARPRETDSLGNQADLAVRLCDRPSQIVESFDGGNEPGIQSRSRAKHIDECGRRTVTPECRISSESK